MPPVRRETSNSAPPSDMPYLLPSRGITFAPNISAETYNEPPELITPPESTLFPSSNRDSNELAVVRKGSHSKKKPDDWIPRPPNAFILFRSEFIKSQHVPGDIEANHGNLSKIIGLCWRNLPFSERDVWECKARIAMAEHKAKYPNYKFKPSQKDKDPTPRRRMKEPPVPPDEQRCAEIASLLVCGVKGDELANKVRELDAIRPTERVQMRFDEPVTPSTSVLRMGKAGGGAKKRESGKKSEGERETEEGTERRRSSEPIPDPPPADTEDTKFIPHQLRASRRTSRTTTSRAASASPVKNGRNPVRARSQSLRITTSGEADTPTAAAAQGVYMDVFHSGLGRVAEERKESEEVAVVQEEVQEAGQDVVIEQTGGAMDAAGYDAAYASPADMYNTYNWQTSPQMAAAVAAPQVWTPNSPSSAAVPTQQAWTPHSPPVQHVYADSPLASPAAVAAGSPFLQAQQQYAQAPVQYASPGEEYAAAPYTPTSPHYPPPTPTSPAEFEHPHPQTQTHAPVPRNFLDMENLTNAGYYHELENQMGVEMHEMDMQEQLYQYPPHVGAGAEYAGYTTGYAPQDDGSGVMYDGGMLEGLQDYHQAVQRMQAQVTCIDPALMKGGRAVTHVGNGVEEDGLSRHPAAAC